MPVYALENHIPVISAESFVHPSAEIIGDVIIEADCYIGPGAALRGDFGRITVKRGSNVQDNCVLHSFPGGDCLLEENSHVGHGAILHGCHLAPDCLIGMHAVIMDNATIGAESIVAATSFVKAGAQFDPRSMIVGTPAKRTRAVGDDELNWKQRGTAEYQNLALRCRQTLREVEPLRAVEPERPRYSASSHRPKGQQ